MWSALRRRLPGGLRRAVRGVLGRARVEEVNWIHEALVEDRPSGVMIDVGAHWGGAAEPFLRSGWKVWAFEPDAANARVLERMARKYPVALSVDKRAVSNEDNRKVQFYTSPLSTGISGLSAFDKTHQPSGTVTTVRLDRFCEENNVDQIDFLKVDTEGYDLFVLQSLDWTVASPDVLMVEFEDRKTVPLGYRFHDLGDLLLSHGYSPIVSEWLPVERYGGSHEWLRAYAYGESEPNPESWGNLIATRDSSLHSRIVRSANGRAR